MDNYLLLREFRERLIERYDGTGIAEILDLSVEDLWEAFSDRMTNNQELLEETGMNIDDED